MSVRIVRMPQLQNVGPSQKVSCRFPLGVTYEKLYFLLPANVLKSLITNIVLRINNREFQRWASAAHYEVMNAYKGNNTGNASVFVMDFTEAKAKEEVGMKLGTIAATQEAGVQEMTIEFDLGAYTPAGGTIQWWADVEAPSANAIICRVQNNQKVFAAAAEENLYVPFGMNGFQLKRIWAHGTNIDYLRVRRDGVDIHEMIPSAVNSARQVDFGRVPQANVYVVDMIPDSLQSNALNTAMLVTGQGQRVPVQNLDVRCSVLAATTVSLYVESYALNSQL